MDIPSDTLNTDTPAHTFARVLIDGVLIHLALMTLRCILPERLSVGFKDPFLIRTFARYGVMFWFIIKILDHVRREFVAPSIVPSEWIVEGYYQWIYPFIPSFFIFTLSGVFTEPELSPDQRLMAERWIIGFVGCLQAGFALYYLKRRMDRTDEQETQQIEEPEIPTHTDAE